jgi:hypothetical protein
MELKKYYVLSLVVIVIGAILYYFVDSDRVERAMQSIKETALTEQDNMRIPKSVMLASSKVQDSPQTNSKQTSEQENLMSELRKKYYPKFDEANSLAETKLTLLIQQAEKEVKVKKDNNQDLTKLPLKYGEILNRYDENTKAQYDAILLEVQKQVSDPVVTSILGVEFLEHFHTKKEDRKQKLSEAINKLL